MWQSQNREFPRSEKIGNVGPIRGFIRSSEIPMIRQVSAARAADAQAPYVVLVVPLLVESGDYRTRVDRVAVVDVPETVQIARTMARSRLDRDQVLQILSAQASREARLAAADDVIDNAGDRAALDARVATLHVDYLARASRRS